MFVQILVGAIAVFAFAALWHTVLFGRTWARLMGFTDADMNEAGAKSMVPSLVGNFILNLIGAWAFVYLLNQFDGVSLGKFLTIALVAWVGCGFPIYVNSALWERKSWQLVMLNSAYGILFTLILSTVVYYLA